MKTIELNEQQVEFLITILNYKLEEFTGKTGIAIAKQIINKLEEE